MTEREPVEITSLDCDQYPTLPWSRPRDFLTAGVGMASTSFLGTTRPDGRPHAAGIGPVWFEGDLYFHSSPGARKARNLAACRLCTISVRLTDLDLVLEGEAARVTDRPTLEQVARRFHGVGWQPEVVGDALTAPFNAPSAGPPPWHLYRFTIHTAFGVAIAEPFGATRWCFTG